MMKHKNKRCTVSDSIAEMYYVIAYTRYVPDGDMDSPNVTLDLFLSKSETLEEEFHDNEQGTESGVYSVTTIEEVIDSIKNHLTSLKFDEDISKEERQIIEAAVKCSMVERNKQKNEKRI